MQVHYLTFMQKKTYRVQLESMLVTHVYPEFQSQFGYMRARVSPFCGRIAILDQ